MLPYNANYPNAQAGWQQNMHNGLLVPDSIVKSQIKAKEEREKALRGRFFSDITYTYATGTQGVIDPPYFRPPMPFLKRVGRKCLLDASIIMAIKKSMVRFAKVCDIPGYQLGFRVVHRRETDPTFRPEEHEAENWRMRCKAMERLILNIGGDGDFIASSSSFASFISAVIHDELTIDRKVMIKMLDSNKRPTSYHFLPGETIRPTLSLVAPWIAKWEKERGGSVWKNPQRAADRLAIQMYEQGIRDADGRPVDLANSAYVQIIDRYNGIITAWPKENIAVDLVNPVNEIDMLLYGESPVEASLDISLQFMKAFAYQDSLFDMDYPENLLLIKGDYDREGLKAWKQQILEQHGNAKRLVMLATGPQGETDAKVMPLKHSPQDMLFGELIRLLAAHKCAFYRVHPSSINFQADQGPGESGLPQQRNYLVKLANEEGFRGPLEHLGNWLTDQIIAPHEPDLVLKWEGLDMVPYDMMVQRVMQLTASGLSSIDEGRGALGKTPLPLGMPGKNLGEYPVSPIVVAIMGQIQAQKQMEMMQQQQSNPANMSQPAAGGAGFGGAQGLPQDGDAGSGGAPSGPPPPPRQGQPPPRLPVGGAPVNAQPVANTPH